MDASALSFQMGDRLSALGSPVGEPLELQPPPLRFYAGSILLVVLGLAGLVGAYFVHVSDGTPGDYVLGVAGLLVGGAGAALLVRRAGLRCRVQLYDHGLAVTRGAKLETMSFDAPGELRLEEREKLDNGRHAGWWRSLRATGQGETLRLDHFHPEGADDLVGRLLGEVLGRAADAADKRRAENPLRGKGWTLDAEGFRAGGGPAVRLDEITQAAMFEGKVALWRGTEQEPFFAVKDGTANARLLLTLAERHRAKDVEADPATLGRVLFQKKSSKFLAILLLVFMGLPMLAGGAGMLAGTDAERFPVTAFLGGLGALFTFGGLWMLFARFQCYERGLKRRTLFGTRTLRYAEIDHFSYQAVRHYHNGAYTGTHVSMSFRPAEGRAVSFSTTTMGNDQDLEFLRDQVARMVAGRLYQAVGRGEEVGWGRNAKLTKDALVFYADKLIGRGPLTSMAWAAATRTGMQDGVFALYPPEGGKAVLKIQVGEDNFFPGLLVYQQLVADALEPPKT